MRVCLPILLLFYSFQLFSQEVTVYKTFDEFKTILEQKDDRIHIVNFWATWCKPCIQELPYFEALRDDYSSDELEVTLVSLDFGTQLDSRVKPFIEKKNIKSNVVLLDDPKSSVWIDLVDKSWSGAIPATVFYKNENNKFFEKEFHSKEELKNIISSFQNKN